MLPLGPEGLLAPYYLAGASDCSSDRSASDETLIDAVSKLLEGVMGGCGGSSTKGGHAAGSSGSSEGGSSREAAKAAPPSQQQQQQPNLPVRVSVVHQPCVPTARARKSLPVLPLCSPTLTHGALTPPPSITRC